MTLEEAKHAIRGGAYFGDCHEQLADSGERCELAAWFVREPGVPNLAARQPIPEPVAPERSPANAPAPALDIHQARGAGYTGDPCPVCGSIRLKRNGSCLLCEACGSTTGCS